MKKYFNILLIIFVALLLSNCGKGIEPYPEPINPENTGFSGKIIFKGEWPAGVKRTHIVLFKDAINTEEDFFPPNLSYVSENIDSGTTQLYYNSKENNLLGVQITSGTYKYIVVAQSTKEELSLARADWFVVGVYYNNGDYSKPGSINIKEGQMLTDININCDFNNPPPQPPGG